MSTYLISWVWLKGHQPNVLAFSRKRRKTHIVYNWRAAILGCPYTHFHWLYNVTMRKAHMPLAPVLKEWRLVWCLNCACRRRDIHSLPSPQIWQKNQLKTRLFGIFVHRGCFAILQGVFLVTKNIFNRQIPRANTTLGAMLSEEHDCDWNED